MVAWKPLGMIEAFLQISSWKLYTIGWAKYVIIAFLPLSIKDIPPSSQLCSKVQTPGIILMKRRQMQLKSPLNVKVAFIHQSEVHEGNQESYKWYLFACTQLHPHTMHARIMVIIPIEKLSTTYNKKN